MVSFWIDLVVDPVGAGRKSFFMSGAGGFVASLHEGFDLEIRQFIAFVSSSC